MRHSRDEAYPGTKNIVEMHTEWCPAWAIRNIRDYIFHGTGGRIVQCSTRKCGMCPSRQGIIRALAAYSCNWGVHQEYVHIVENAHRVLPGMGRKISQ